MLSIRVVDCGVMHAPFCCITWGGVHTGACVTQAPFCIIIGGAQYPGGGWIAGVDTQPELSSTIAPWQIGNGCGSCALPSVNG